MVIRYAVGYRVSSLSCHTLQTCYVWAGYDSAGSQLRLQQVDDVHEVLILLTNVTDLDGRSIAKLPLHGEVPLGVHGWPEIDVERVNVHSLKANRI